MAYTMTVRIEDEELEKRLKEYCDKTGATRNGATTRALDAWLPKPVVAKQ